MSAAEGEEQVADSPNVDFTPVVTLPEVETKTLEEDEEEIFKIRARLFRYASECSPPEWKERGTGDVRLLKKEGRLVRLVMRRDKTLKICANHYITKKMDLRSNKGSDRAWVYTTLCDFADEETKSETLAIRFASSINAQAFKAAFDGAQVIARQVEPKNDNDDDNDEDSDEDSDEDADKSTASEKAQGESSATTGDSAAPPTSGEATSESTAAAEEVTNKLKEMKVSEEGAPAESGKSEETVAAAATTEETSGDA